jgi:hypothetical protein
MTTKERFETYGKNVYATWAKRCDFFHFLANDKMEKVPTIIVNVPDQNKEYVWEKLR